MISLGIFSFNIGDNINAKMFDFINIAIHKQCGPKLPDILCFCFQEVGLASSDLEVLIGTRFKQDYSLITFYSACLALTNFQVKTVILVKDR
jgi:hypothetical protein